MAMSLNPSIERFAFFLIEEFPLSCLAAAIEPLRAANRLSGHEIYRWSLTSDAGTSCLSSCGIEVPTVPQSVAFQDVDFAFVCGGLKVRPANEQRHIAELRKLSRRGVRLGALSAGTWMLARAGLLAGYRCTVHWENRAALLEDFPDLDCSGKIYEIDRDRLTCSGGSAAIDLMLHLIADKHGANLAQRVANQFHHERIRDSSDEQKGGDMRQLSALPSVLKTALREMQSHIENPLPIPEVAHAAGITERHLERLCLRYLGSSPGKVYLALRIDRGRELLLHSDQSILEVAVATGFGSSSHFSDWFKRRHGACPSEFRGRALGVKQRVQLGAELA
jgi:transcriptional regulator GlxA family with amidase domain